MIVVNQDPATSIHRQVIIPALAFMDRRYRSPPDRPQVSLLAIGLQESDLLHRRQLPQGPARGLWQFEPIGLREVLTGYYTRDEAARICRFHGYTLSDGTTPDHELAFKALENNDQFACKMARLLLWGHPDPLPATTDIEEGWRQYVDRWKPGKPRPEKWEQNWNAARNTVRRYYNYIGTVI